MIDRFDGKYRFLSNFYPSPVVMYGTTYPTVEHAFQAAKTHNPLDRGRIWRAETPGKAKRLGRGVQLRPDWNEFRLFAMKTLVQRKFQDEELAEKLLQTMPHELIEGNTWGDTFWGVCRGRGENHLGRILMEVREELWPE